MGKRLKTATESGRITWKRFERDFPLVKNHLDANASFEGCLFETYGEELAFVRTMVAQNRVLTITGCDGKSIVGTGFHFVNRLGYLITKNPVTYDFWITY